mmetsp:Transcript_7818/g.17870  ORF Transcript_7818/g.17870 Transcript_7818/m.17870 type:complete len:83 (-) Transcript_7818:27-275(-)
MQPGSARDPTAFASIIVRKSSMRSSLISASTTMQMGMAQRLVLLTFRVVAVEVFDTGANAETATDAAARRREVRFIVTILDP